MARARRRTRRHSRTPRLLVLIVVVAVGAGLFYALRPLWQEEPCTIRWRASSIEIVNGKATKPYVTTNCDQSGNPQKRR